MLILLMVVLLLPFLMVVLLSVVSQWRYPRLWDAGWTLMHWQQTLQGRSGLVSSFLLSVALSGTVAVTATVLGFFSARSVMYHPRGKALLSFALYPYVIAPVVLAAMLQHFFIRAGLSGNALGVAIAQLLFVYPYSLLFFSGFWSLSIRDMEAQAATLGASRWQIARRVLLPLSRSWIFLGFFQCFLISWFEYGLTQFIGVGKVATLTIAVFTFIREANPYLAAVASCLLVFPPLLLLALNRQVFFRKNVPLTHD